MIWEDFLNSQWYDWRGSGASEDRLELPAWRNRFLSDYGLESPGDPSAEELHVMRQLRDRLRALTIRISKSVRSAGAPPLADEDLIPLNELLAASPSTKKIAVDGGSLELQEVPLSNGWSGILSKVAMAYAASLAQGELERFRMCDNPDCLWIYYDTTRNRSKRYCDDKCCGNLMKVRRFRERAKSSGVSPANQKTDEKRD